MQAKLQKIHRMHFVVIFMIMCLLGSVIISAFPLAHAIFGSCEYGIRGPNGECICPPGRALDPDGDCQPFYYPPPPPTEQINLMDIEVTQAVQDLKNSVPLVAGKPTLVRVYISSNTAVPSTVTGCLMGGNEHPTPICVYSTNTVTLPLRNTVPDSMRNSLDDTLNFILPPEWTRPGTLKLSFVPRDANDNDFPCRNVMLRLVGSSQSCRDIALTQPVVGVDNTRILFQASPPLRVTAIGIQYTEGGITHQPNQDQYRSLFSYLKRLYPTSDIRYSIYRYPIFFNHFPTCEEVNSRLSQLYELYASHARLGIVTTNIERYYGIVPDDARSMRGCTPALSTVSPITHGDVASGAASDLDTFTHELGHSYGRYHPVSRADCGNTDDFGWFGNLPIIHSIASAFAVDNSYPHPNGAMDHALFNPNPVAFGYDFGDARITGASPRLINPFSIGDLMSYYCDTWISSYTYTSLLVELMLIDAVLTQGTFIPSGRILSTADYLHPRITNIAERYISSSYLTDTNVFEPEASMDNEIKYIGSEEASKSLLIHSNIDFTNKKDKPTLTQEPYMVLSDPYRLTTVRPNTSSFSIDLIDSEGNILSRYPFMPRPYSDMSASKEIALISEIVPFIPGTKKIVISLKDQVLSSRIVSDNAPEINEVNVTPTKGNTKVLTVAWNATDLDNEDKLTFSVGYSADDGKSWLPVATNIGKGFSQLVNTDYLPASKHPIFRVIATDGVNTDLADHAVNLSIVNKPPDTSIVLPFPNTIFKGGVHSASTVVLEGEASDLEDGTLDGKALEWTSNLQGFLGNGKSLSKTGLNMGVHNVTLTARDSNGAITNATSTIYVVK